MRHKVTGGIKTSKLMTSTRVQQIKDKLFLRVLRNIMPPMPEMMDLTLQQQGLYETQVKPVAKRRVKTAIKTASELK